MSNDYRTYALIEYMPAQHRESHRAAGNCGSYPHNGACRCYVPADVTDELDTEWSRIVEAAVPELALRTDWYDVFDALPEDA